MADPEKAIVVESGEDGHEDMEEEEENAGDSGVIKNPALAAALEGKLTALNYMETFSAPVKRRLKALKKLQLEATRIEAKFYQEVHKLECKYHELYKPFYEKRSQITNGDHEPNDDECEWPSDDEEAEVELAGDVKNKVKLDGESVKEDVKGIPEFWLTALKNVDMMQDMIQEHDEDALKSLKDLKVTFNDGCTDGKPMGFTLHFYFDANDYFTNSVLTKEYDMKCEPSESDPFSFEGPEIFRCRGCPINWKMGKNLTVKTVRKKQKHKSKGSVRTFTKQVKNDSFFNFFDPPPLSDDLEEEIDSETQELLTVDFEIGHYIRERVIPRAVLFFTGEILEEEDFEEEEESNDEEEGEEDDDDDQDPPKKKGDQNPQECKQQ